MRTRTRLTLAALTLAALAAAARAQEQEAWISFTPEGESFTVKMPGQPAPVEQRLSAGELKVKGRRYEAAGGDGSVYLVLSLRDTDGAAERLVANGYRSERFNRESPYLDEIAKLAWEAFVAGLAYRREFELAGRPAREYFVRRGEAGGPVYVCADGPQIYVVAAIGPEPQSKTLKQFVDSFELKTEAGAPTFEVRADPANAGVGPGRGGAHSGPFAGAELTHKARITSRPEPLYTEDARKFQVTGTVRTRVVLAASGEVEHVEVVKGLPHGLTLSAVEAARKIQFEAARKDGRPVAQFAIIEYNFNVY